MRTRPFQQVDVFTAVPCYGNPLAVVLDGSGLTDAAMQRFAHWTNLSETTFILPPTEAGRAAGADYRVRIFTPGEELPFAGHPTLGSCHARRQAGGQPRARDAVLQECGVGLVRVRRDGARLAFAAPPLTRSEPDATLMAAVIAALGLQATQVVAAQMLDNGPRWLGLLLGDPDALARIDPDHAKLKNLEQKVGVASVKRSNSAMQLISRSSREARAFDSSKAVAEDPPNDADLLVRAFAAPVGIPEDPVTGSLNASLAQWLIADGHLAAPYIASQGENLGRDGVVHISTDAGGQVWVGGESVTCISGEVTL